MPITGLSKLISLPLYNPDAVNEAVQSGATGAVLTEDVGVAVVTVPEDGAVLVIAAATPVPPTLVVPAKTASVLLWHSLNGEKSSNNLAVVESTTPVTSKLFAS